MPYACFLTDIGEGAIAVVAIESIRRAFKQRGVAIGARLAFAARTIRDIYRVFEIVDDEQIEVSIPVIIEEARAAAPRRIADSGVLGDVCEGAIAVVTVKHIRSEIGDVDVGVAIVVVIGAGNALSVVAPVANACAGGDVCKGAVAVILIKCGG